jgi:transposase InsO family protein
MYMAYTTNPHLPHVRMKAVQLVRSGWSTVRVARHTGYAQSTISKWCRRAPDSRQSQVIPTRSSRSYHHPHELSEELVDVIIRYRRERNQCAEIIHHRMSRDGYDVSLSSVKRTLRREGLTRYSKWKKWHKYPPRPMPETPGILVEVDTIHDGAHTARLYVYTLIDVFSRFAYALPSLKINTHASLRFVNAARDYVPFPFQTLQSDHGQEFSEWFTKRVGEQDLSHRHSRVRTPNDNAHLERWNRTLQDECLRRIPRNLRVWRKEIPVYLRYYNNERPHMALDMKTPVETLKTIPSY